MQRKGVITNMCDFNFTISHRLSVVGLSAHLLAVHRLCGFVEGRLSQFLPRWLRTSWQSMISQGKIP